MEIFISDVVVGFAGLAPLFDSTPGALRAQKSRGLFTLEPISRVGNLQLYDRQEALRYAAVYAGQRRKRKA